MEHTDISFFPLRHKLMTHFKEYDFICSLGNLYGYIDILKYGKYLDDAPTKTLLDKLVTKINETSETTRYLMTENDKPYRLIIDANIGLTLCQFNKIEVIKDLLFFFEPTTESMQTIDDLTTRITRLEQIIENKRVEDCFKN